MDLSDFIQPLIIENSEDFKPREAKARFERMCQMLAGQAFWLSLFEYLEKHQAAISAVQFKAEFSRFIGVADMMIPVPIEGADPKAIERAIKASAGAFSKTRGKITGMTASDLAGVIRRCLPADGLATLDRKEQILKNALGGELYGLRLSFVESKELDSITSASMASALTGRPKPRL